MPIQLTVVAADLARSLQKQGILFKVSSPRPFRQRIYIIENYPFLETELVTLLESGGLHLRGIRELRQRIDKR